MNDQHTRQRQEFIRESDFDTKANRAKGFAWWSTFIVFIIVLSISAWSITAFFASKAQAHSEHGVFTIEEKSGCGCVANLNEHNRCRVQRTYRVKDLSLKEKRKKATKIPEWFKQQQKNK